MNTTVLILDKIRESGGKISFSDYMELALYAPELGYYTGNNKQFGRTGDFITAPELSPLFGQCISRSISELPYSHILEFGAGTGALAKTLLDNKKIEKYFILDISPHLRELQKKNLADYLDKISWVDELPTSFEGIIIANEILDAFPVMKFLWKDNQAYEYYVNENFEWELVPIQNDFIKHLALPDNYSSEINVNIKPWLNNIDKLLNKGIVLIFDYGFPRAEYYHPQRSMGTIMCHYQHKAHSDPLTMPGSQDITAHVDFTSVTEAGLDVLGYTSQAAFLLECGITELSKTIQDTQAIKLLTHPNEMGELFKVMALSKNYEGPIMGFTLHDRRHRL